MSKEKTETEKILEDKELMKIIRESRRKGSKSSPYEPLGKPSPKVLELAGNELGWIFKLAEQYFDSPQFRDWIKRNKLEKLDNALKLIMCKIHPNNFNVGDSETEWLLINKTDLVDKLEKWKKPFTNTLFKKGVRAEDLHDNFLKSRGEERGYNEAISDVLMLFGAKEEHSSLCRVMKNLYPEKKVQKW